jgi:hypothetical protein
MSKEPEKKYVVTGVADSAVSVIPESTTVGRRA